jgi:hypothetical protein
MTSPTVFPSRVRRELLAEHRSLRLRLADVERRAAEVRARGTRAAELALLAAAGDLRLAIQRHNRHELENLAPLLLEVDAWGELRVAQMVREHTAEDETLLAMLDARTVGELARDVPPFAARLREHMGIEERSFLAADLLRDDLVTVGVSS